MKAEVPLMRFDAPIAVFGGCYSNLEATVALVRHIERLAYLQAIAFARVMSSPTERTPKPVSSWCAALPSTS